MDNVIEDLKSISGVLGGLLYNSQKGVIASNLPPIFKIENLTEIGKMVSKIYGTGSGNFTEITEISLYYEESVLIVKEVSEGVFLIVLGDPSSNINLLTISMNLVTENLRKITDISSFRVKGLAWWGDIKKLFCSHQ